MVEILLAQSRQEASLRYISRTTCSLRMANGATRRGCARTSRRPNRGVREVDDQIWLVSFLDYDLGYFDNERGRVEPGPNPFAPDKVLTMCPE